MNLWQLMRAQWDRFGAGVLFVLGALALMLGWVGVSREALTALQIPYIVSGGLGGIFLLGLGAVLWLSADLRDEWRKLDAIEAAQRPASTALAATIDNGWDEASAVDESAALLSVSAVAAVPASPGDVRRRRQLRASS